MPALYHPIASRWATLLLYAAVGAIVFQFALAAGWDYARRAPDPLTFFAPWFVWVCAWLVAVGVFRLAIEPLRFRFDHLRRLHLHPPLWVSVLLALVGATALEHYIPSRIVPSAASWTSPDISALLAAAALLALGWSHRDSSTAKGGHTTPWPDTVLTWPLLKAWIEREVPNTIAPDLFDHKPICDRLVADLTDSADHSIALIGPVGSGKTTVLRNALTRAASTVPGLVVADFSCWSLAEGGEAPRMALETALASLDGFVDVQSLRGLPASYQRLASADSSGWLSRALSLGVSDDPVRQLQRLAPVLASARLRLVLVVEDAERAGSDLAVRPLERLLWTLRDVQGVSFIISMAPGAGFDQAKLCDHLERIPALSPGQVETVLALGYAHWRTPLAEQLEVVSTDSSRDRLGLASVDNSLARYMRRRNGDGFTDSLAALLDSPRKLKHFLRDVDRGWSVLRGEVDLDDLVALTALRHAAPQAYEFIVANHDAARVEGTPDSIFDGESVKTIKARWQALMATLDAPLHVQAIVNVLRLPQLSTIRFGSPALQGVFYHDPTDYLGRILSRSLPHRGARDQIILRDKASWREGISNTMIRSLGVADSNSDDYSSVWEHLSGDLSAIELLKVAGQLIDLLVASRDSDASMSHPAMRSVWRLSRKAVQRDSATDWIADRIRQTLPTHLQFATDIFQYWCSVPHGLTSEAHRISVRDILVSSAKQVFTTPTALLKSVATSSDYPITRLVYPPPTEEPPDTVRLDSWQWLVAVALPAASTSPERIIPDLAVLVTDTSHGFRSRDFTQLYKLKRDWCASFFGSQLREALLIFDSYAGDDKHARAAKAEAHSWLGESP